VHQNFYINVLSVAVKNGIIVFYMYFSNHHSNHPVNLPETMPLIHRNSIIISKNGYSLEGAKILCRKNSPYIYLMSINETLSMAVNPIPFSIEFVKAQPCRSVTQFCKKLIWRLWRLCEVPSTTHVHFLKRYNIFILLNTRTLHGWGHLY